MRPSSIIIPILFGVFLFAVIFLLPHGARQVAYMIEHLFKKGKP